MLLVALLSATSILAPCIHVCSSKSYTIGFGVSPNFNGIQDAVNSFSLGSTIIVLLNCGGGRAW
ncbi:MAG: hypothetical protein DRJ62_06105 [Thermoprotei archaeon]|nr:MAG: hypothetical protein DRJ62_06105 [Thermoprotei archaeon]